MTTDCFEDTKLLIGIGPPRTASKWLSLYCETHPQILMSPIRVLHYFDSMHGDTERDFNQMFLDRLAQADASGNGQTKGAKAIRDRVRMIDDPDAFIDYYRSRWSGERVLADITPSYAGQKDETFKAMMEAHPNVNILMVMRNPIDRFWSGLGRKNTKVEDSVLAEKLAKYVSTEQQGTINSGNYANILESLETCVPEDRYRAVFFESFLTERGMAEFCDWLGVDRVPAALNQSENKTCAAGPTPKQRQQVHDVLAPIYTAVQNRFGSDIPESWQRDIDMFS